MFHEVPQENELTVHSNTISVNMLPQNVGSNEKKTTEFCSFFLEGRRRACETHTSLSLFLSHSQFAASFHRVLKTRNTESQGFIFGAKFRQNVKNKNKREYSGTMFPFSPLKKIAKFRQISPKCEKREYSGTIFPFSPLKTIAKFCQN